LHFELFILYFALTTIPVCIGMDFPALQRFFEMFSGYGCEGGG